MILKETKYKGYYVDDEGNVYSTLTTRKKVKDKTLLSPYIDKIGRKQVVINSKSIRIHRLMWEAFNGKIPKGMVIDHIDRNASNNNLNNLRLATRRENQRNTIGRPSTNTSGYKGVHFNKKRNHFQAYIKLEHKHKYLGSFKTAEEASKAYDEAAIIYFKQFAATNKELVK